MAFNYPIKLEHYEKTCNHNWNKIDGREWCNRCGKTKVNKSSVETKETNEQMINSLFNYADENEMIYDAKNWGGEKYDDHFRDNYLKANFLRMLASQQAQMISTLRGEIKEVWASIPTTDDYANGWNDSKKEHKARISYLLDKALLEEEE